MDEIVVRESLGIIEKAREIVVVDDASYISAGDMLKAVKKAQKAVTDYFEPMRKETYDAYKAVTDKKASIIDPLKECEKDLKKKVSWYIAELERKRREEEEKLRKQAFLEAQEKLREAQAAELDGDDDKAAAIFADAEVMMMVSNTAVIEKSESFKQDGVSTRKTWEIVSIDNDNVPVSFGGKLIRPVDESAVMQIIKDSDGKVEIPGVVYKESVSVVVRA